MRLLIVEDEQHLSIGLKFNFEAEGYDVVVTGDGPSALELLRADPYGFSMIILDLMLPGMSGYETCKQMREINPDIPILVLSARTLSEDKTRAFDVGVDQYMTKPFELRELLSRVRNLLHRRTHAPAEMKEDGLQTADFGNVHVDFRKHTISVGGKPKKLTPLLLKLLRLFVLNEGIVLERSYLLKTVWGFDHAPTTRTVDMAVMQLRKILEEDPATPRHFVSIRGAGYKFIKNIDDANSGD